MTFDDYCNMCDEFEEYDFVAKDYFPIAVMIGIIMMFSLFFSANDVLLKQNTICDLQICSHAILIEMENEGYLTDELQASLISMLTELSVENITFEGSTTTRKMYGEYIYLNIHS